MHKGDREEDTCHRNIWANQVVMRCDVTASAMPGDPREFGVKLSLGRHLWARGKSSESADAAHIYSHSDSHIEFEQNTSRVCKESELVILVSLTPIGCTNNKAIWYL